jgi:hypothetical protein
MLVWGVDEFIWSVHLSGVLAQGDPFSKLVVQLEVRCACGCGVVAKKDFVSWMSYQDLFLRGAQKIVFNSEYISVHLSINVV